MCTAASAMAQNSGRMQKAKDVFGVLGGKIKDRKDGSKPAPAVEKPDNLKIKY